MDTNWEFAPPEIASGAPSSHLRNDVCLLGAGGFLWRGFAAHKKPFPSLDAPSLRGA